MTWWGWILVGVAAVPALGFFTGLAVALIVGGQSHERRGTLELDTPEARAALRDPLDPPETTRLESDTMGRRR